MGIPGAGPGESQTEGVPYGSYQCIKHFSNSSEQRKKKPIHTYIHTYIDISIHTYILTYIDTPCRVANLASGASPGSGWGNARQI